MNDNPGTYQIDSTSGTTSAALLLATPPMSFLASLPPAPSQPVAVLPGHPAPSYSPVIGSGGGGQGWPFQDFNMMNDPEGNLAGLPPIYTEDGAGGQGGDPFAFAPGMNDFAMAGYANAGASLTGSDVIQMAVGDPTYTAGAQQLQNSNLGGAAQVGIQELAQVSTGINWGELVYNPQVDIAQGFKELTESAGAQALAAAAGTGACAYAAYKFVVSGGSNPDVMAGKAAYGAMQCAFGAVVTLGKTIQAAESTMTPEENAALSVMYHGIFEDVRNYVPSGGGGVNGGDAVHAFATARAGGSMPFDATMGGKLNFLAGSTYNSTTGGINVAHA